MYSITENCSTNYSSFIADDIMKVAALHQAKIVAREKDGSSQSTVAAGRNKPSHVFQNEMVREERKEEEV